MKARVKATGEIWTFSQIDEITFKSAINGHLYCTEELEFIEASIFSPDYWEKLKHQCAGMAMQGLVKTYEQMMRADIECKMDCCEYVDAEVANGVLRSHAEACAEFCAEFATALVNKLKEEEK